MSHIHRYLQQFSSNLDCDLNTKQELIEEFQDHLMLLKKEYIVKGLPDDIAEKCAIFDFGEHKSLQHKLEKTLNPFKKVYRVTLWLSLSVYIWFVVMACFIGKFDILGVGVHRGVTLRFNWGIYSDYNLIPLKNIDNEIIRSLFWVANKNALDITFFTTALGGVLLFTPLGLFLPILFKVKTLSKLVIYTVVTSVFIELVQFITNTGVFNVNDILFYFSGSFIGWLIYSSLRNIKVSRLGKFQAN